MAAPPVTDTAPARCAVLARALDEPLAGTAPVAGRWLCLEQRGAWPRDVAAHPDPPVAALADRAVAAGWRLLLIRRPGRPDEPADAPDRVFFADTTPARPRVSTLTAGRLAALPLPTGGRPLPGTPVADPLLLVCTHGRRDRCCALDGRALVAAVTAGCPELAPRVWESSHLGGHRFAPTALVLPTGYLYGRLDPATAVDVLKAAEHGEMEPLLCRGRSTWSPAGQVAELAVRRATGLREAAALHVEQPEHCAGDGGRSAATTASTVASGSERHGATAVNTVHVRVADGRRWAVDVEQVAPPGTRPTTCGADPAPVAALRAGPMRELTAADPR